MTPSTDPIHADDLLEQVRQTQLAQDEQLKIINEQLTELRELVETTLDLVKSL